MQLGSYLMTLAVGTALAWCGWILVLVRVNPEEAGIPGLILFYVTLAVAVLGTLTLLGTVVRISHKREEPPARHAKLAFRHALILTCVAIVLLMLAAAGLLNWLSFFLVALGAVGIEAAALALSPERGR